MCIRDSFLCRIMASAIFFFSFSLSRFYLMILSLAAWLIWCSCCIFAILVWAFYSLLIFNFVTSEALFLVSSIFFQVLNSSYLRRAILFASNCASLSILTFKKLVSEKTLWWFYLLFSLLCCVENWFSRLLHGSKRSLSFDSSVITHSSAACTSIVVDIW